MTTSQTKQSAERLCAFRPPLLTNAHQGSGVMGHDRPPPLHHGALRTLGANLASTACPHTGDRTFHHRTAVTTGTGPLHLVRGPCTVHPRFVEQGQHFCGAWLRVAGLHRLGDTNAEHPTGVERLPQGRVIAPQSTGDRGEGWRRWPADACDGGLDLVKQGEDSAGLGGMAHWDSTGEDNARRWR